MRLPDDSHRTTMYGQTGSGKTVAALWQLSERSWTHRPWVVYDFKGDKHIAQIPHTTEIGLDELPKADQPGIYIARPIPDSDDDAVERSMWDIWRQQRTGVFVDEGYMVNQRNKAYQALLTQGRSKDIPMITLTQRPVWLSRFAISEADFHQVFFLADQADRDIVQRFIPHDFIDQRPPKYHSFFYDVGEDEFTGLKPVPAPARIMATFERRWQEQQERQRGQINSTVPAGPAEARRWQFI